MPERVDHQFGRTKRSTYNWDVLLDGDTWRLLPSRDFECKPESVVVSARREAKKRGFRLRAEVMAGDNGHPEGAVILQAWLPLDQDSVDNPDSTD